MAKFSFLNTSGMAITTGPAVSQTITSSVTGTVTDVSVSLNGLSHTFGDDLDMLLVGPNGTNNLMFMSDVGGSTDFVGDVLTITDAVAERMPDGTAIGSGAYKPTNFNASAPETDASFGSATGGIVSPGPVGGGTFASAFGGSSASGNWTLYVADDLAGDDGSITSWGITITIAGTAAAVSGTGGADSFSLVWTGATTGFYRLNGATVQFSDVTAFSFDGGSGNDTIVAGSGNEVVNDGDGVDLVQLGNGNDTLIMGDSFAGGDSYDGGGGIDTFDASAFSWGTAVTIDLTAQNWSYSGGSESIIGFENIRGANDFGGNLETLRGNALNNSIFGNGGNDALFGMDGDDLLDGGAGADSMTGGTGSDIYVVAAAGDQTIELLNEGTDTVRSYINWTLGANVERLELLGSAANGTGNALNNTLVGNSLANVMNGGDGQDYIITGAGRDTLNGGNGNDTLVGGAGGDTMNGGANNDTFLYLALSDSGVGATNRDSINAFVHGQDKINLAALDANAGAAGNQAFSFIGTGGFSGVAGQLRYAAYGSTCIIDADVNGDKVADFQIAVSGTNFMTGTDFIL
ncbi:calcium-binding protein [Mesorhizobium sp. CAU 1732]|uniref:calcium-binding protein n=1 Tax=Mesorhizobium sp. CAU 1732 TaxID=3140358 RepID=UPI003261C6C8